MTWVLILMAAITVFAGMVLLLKLPRGGWELVGAALLVGIAGYALQGHPNQPGSPRQAVENDGTADEALLEARRQMGSASPNGQTWLIIADALSRNGQHGTAAKIIRNGLKNSPNDADLWVALGNALVGHSNGVISPAAQFAFQRAAQIEPAHPGPPFFFGLALAQTGRLMEARTIWSDLLAQAPDGAPWKADLEQRLARLDGMIAQSAPPAMPAAPASSQPAATP